MCGVGEGGKTRERQKDIIIYPDKNKPKGRVRKRERERIERIKRNSYTSQVDIYRKRQRKMDQVNSERVRKWEKYRET